MLKTLLYYCIDWQKHKVLYVDLQEYLGIKPGTNLPAANDKPKAILGNKLLEVKFLNTDEHYTILRSLWAYIDSRFEKVIMMIPQKTFAGLSAINVAELLQLSPFRAKCLFSPILIRMYNY